ncbi:MAG: type III-A CRISPR-associated RAMP protein Csm4 [Anaerolineae bacterium]
MPQLTQYHLAAPGVFHFGVRGVEQEETGTHFPSDSLFSAIFSAWLAQGRAPDELTDLFPRQEMNNDGVLKNFYQTTAPFLLTSLFPRANQLRFYPALPLSWLLSKGKLQELHEGHRLKEVKRIKYISEALFLKALASHWLDDWVPAEKSPTPADQGVYLQGGDLWLTRDEISLLPPALNPKTGKGDPLKALRHARVWHTDKAPRVTVDRITNASAIFHTGRLRYSPECGFWFGVQWQANDAGLADGLRDALAILADDGLGAERNAGYGHFTVTETNTLALPTPQAGDFFVNLSRYSPKTEEVPAIFADERTAYTLTSVAGWLSSPVEPAQRRRRLWLFQEGSVLQQPAEAGALGRLVDVRPVYQQTQFSHPVWRYGLALPVKIQPAGGAR